MSVCVIKMIKMIDFDVDCFDIFLFFFDSFLKINNINVLIKIWLIIYLLN